MILDIIEYFMGLFAFIALCVFLTSGLKSALGVQLGCYFYFIYLMLCYLLFPGHIFTIFTRCVVPFLVIIPALYDRMFDEHEALSDKYFSLSFGLGLTFSAVIVVSLFIKGFRSIDVFVIQMLLTSVFVVICRKSKVHYQTYFMIFGVSLLFLFFAACCLHIVLSKANINVRTLGLSLKLHLIFFIPVVFFFFGNWAKMGLFLEPSIHRKCFFWTVSMLAIPVFTREPELRPFLDRIPLLGDKLADLSAAGILVFPAIMGLIFPWEKEKSPSA